MLEHVFGPMFGVELARLTRGRWPFVLRVVLGLSLLAGLLLALAGWCLDAGRDFSDALFGGLDLGIAGRARFAALLTKSALVAQTFAVWLVVPGYVAGVLPSERSARVLELVEAAGVPARSAVGSKLAARAVVLGGLLLTGVPVLALVSVWGGVALGGVLLAEGMLAASAFSAGVVALACSLAKVPTPAAFALAYTLSMPAMWPAAMVAAHVDQPLGGMLAGAGVCCSVLTVLVVTAILATGGVLWTWPAEELLDARVGDPVAAVGRPSPPMGDDALWWKEAKVGRGSLQRFAGWHPGAVILWTFLGLLGLACLSSVSVPPFALCLTAAVTVAGHRAASVVAGERDRQTLDTLLSTPVSRRELAVLKWRAATWAARWPAALAVVFALGGVPRQDGAAGACAAGVAGAAQVAFAASAGLWVSAVSRSASAAVVRVWVLGAGWFAVGAMAGWWPSPVPGLREAFVPVLGPARLLAVAGEREALAGGVGAALLAGLSWLAILGAWRRLERGE